MINETPESLLHYNLIGVVIVSRYSSGCTILSSKKLCKDLVDNSRNRTRTDKVLFENYLAVTHGHPKRDGITEVIDVHMERIPGVTTNLYPSSSINDVMVLGRRGQGFLDNFT